MYIPLETEQTAAGTDKAENVNETRKLKRFCLGVASDSATQSAHLMQNHIKP